MRIISHNSSRQWTGRQGDLETKRGTEEKVRPSKDGPYKPNRPERLDRREKPERPDRPKRPDKGVKNG